MENSSYKILGIDPGTNLMGYAVLEVNGKKLRVLDFGAFNLSKLKQHQDKLKEIYLQTQEIVETYLPKEMAIESPFYGKNVQSMLKLGRAQGVAIAAGITMGLEITEYSPKKIKQSVTGSGNASKEQVASLMEKIFKLNLAEKNLDATDALAAAYCHYNQKSSPLSKFTKYRDWSSYLKDNPGKII
jgi:crossover junction endodeoxyribonuclease RuvC